MKSILHFQIPLLNRNLIDDLAIRPETLGKFIKLAQDKLGEEWIVVASPFDPLVMDLSDNEQKFYNFKMNQINFEELQKLVSQR